MVRAIASIGCVLAFVTALVPAQDAVPRELAAMADTERAFAKTATVKGWRDAFLDFFADDAVALGREVGAGQGWAAQAAVDAIFGGRAPVGAAPRRRRRERRPRLAHRAEHLHQPHGQGAEARPWLLSLDLAEATKRHVARIHRRRRRCARTGLLRTRLHADAVRRSIRCANRWGSGQGSGGEEPGRSGSRSERADGGARSKPGVRQPRHAIVSPPSAGVHADCRRRSHRRVAERARVGWRGQGRRRRSRRRGRFRISPTAPSTSRHPSRSRAPTSGSGTATRPAAGG